ncbi:hypothetical protein [Prescottella subtropica]|uniref:hypothetical protein n=1 Tax=Prescottella subtropica TaxID=2545757 RepID=UPI0010F8BEF3|nr:hypothetical protein [Prescottella subtropica]
MTIPIAPTTVAQLFSDGELAQFVNAAAAHAEKAGGVFALDEGIRIYGERAWATYLRDQMERVGLHEFAARIDPAQFGEHPIITAVNAQGRSVHAH